MRVRKWSRVAVVFIALGWVCVSLFLNSDPSTLTDTAPVSTISSSSEPTILDDGLDHEAGLPVSDNATPHKLTSPPDKAQAVLRTIQERDGDPPPGYVGGKTFHNRERRLPKGQYREYDVNPKVPGKNRGAERIVIEQRTGKAYYTDDHYRTFVPMN